MPWIPELFSEPVLERLREKWERERLEAVRYYDGLMSGEHDALIRSFAGEPVLHDNATPVALGQPRQGRRPPLTNEAARRGCRAPTCPPVRG